MEHFAEIRSNNAWNTSPGVLGIDTEDIKVLSKMNGDITLEDISTELEYKINIKCGKKNVTIPKSVITIGNNSFYGCSSLANIIINEGTKNS